jgi:hypothetical protein
MASVTHVGNRIWGVFLGNMYHDGENVFRNLPSPYETTNDLLAEIKQGDYE